jgi:O-antigen/teichoic acid export membrane protein
VIRLFRNKNIANTFWNIADTFLYPVLFFGSTSFFIQKLGAAQFGIWMLINTIVVSMQLFNFGVGSSVFRNIAYHSAQHNDAGKKQVLSNALSVTSLLFAISVALAGLGAYFVYSHDLLHVEPEFRTICMKGILLAGFIVGFKFFEQVFTSYFKAVEKYNKAMSISTGNRLAALIVNIIALALFKLSILHLLLMIVCVNAIFLIVSLSLLYCDFPKFQFKFDLKLPKHDASFALFTWLQSFVIILTFQADRYFIVDYFGLSALTYYAIVATIFSHIYMLFNSVFAWVAGKLVQLHAKREDTAGLFFAARNMVATGTATMLLVMSLIYPFVFHLILGEKTSVMVHEYTRYFIVFELFFTFSIVPNYYLNAIGLERRYFFFIVFFSILTLAGMFCSIKLFNDPVAVLYGMILSCLISMFVQNVLLNKIISGKMNVREAVAILIPPMVIAYFIVTGNTVAHWAALGLSLPAMYFIYVRGNVEKFKMLFRT